MRATKKPKDQVYDQLIAVVAQPKKSQKAGLRQKICHAWIIKRAVP